MVEFLFSLPLWTLAVILNIWLMGFALTSFWALRRWVLPRLHINTDAALFYGAAVMQSCMVLYGLVTALTAVSVWQRYSDVSDIVSREATAINNLWRDLDGYPQRERDVMREILRGHTNQIIQEAWPLSGFVAMVLFVIIALDRPFRGAMANPADSYQLVHDQLMKK